jgi:hypothetical protein
MNNREARRVGQKLWIDHQDQGHRTLQSSRGNYVRKPKRRALGKCAKKMLKHVMEAGGFRPGTRRTWRPIANYLDFSFEAHVPDGLNEQMLRDLDYMLRELPSRQEFLKRACTSR